MRLVSFLGAQDFLSFAREIKKALLKFQDEKAQESWLKFKTYMF